MAHGFLAYEDSRGEKDYLGMLGRKLYNMAKNRRKKQKGSGNVELEKDGQEVKPVLTEDPQEKPGGLSTAFAGGSIVPFKGSALSKVTGGVQKGLPGAKAVTPEVLGGALTRISRKPGIGAGDNVYDTTATRVADTEALQGIGELIVQSNNNVVEAVMGVQRVNVRVVDSVENLGKLQLAIASREEQQREILAARAQGDAERRLLGSGKDGSDFSKVQKLLGPGKKGGSIVGMPGLGALARGAGMLGRRGLAKTGAKVGAKAGLKAGAKGLGKAFLKKIPLIGLGAGLLFAGQRAMAGDFTGAALELASGAAGTIPGFGTAASIGLDAALAGRDMGLTPFANGGIITRPTASLMGEDGTEGVFPLEGKRGRDAFVQFGEGLLKAQEKNEREYTKIQSKGMSRYFEMEGGNESLARAIADAQDKDNWFTKLLGMSDDSERDGPSGRRPLSPAASNNPLGFTSNTGNDKKNTGNVTGLSNFLSGNPAFTSGYGERNTGIDGASKFHRGYDFGVDPGAKVKAFETGVITNIYKDYGGWDDGIVVRHADGSHNIYGHVQTDKNLEIGSKVEKGDLLGEIRYWPSDRYPAGRQHLHFERIPAGGSLDGGQIDPGNYLTTLEAEHQAEVDGDTSKALISTRDRDENSLGKNYYTFGSKPVFEHNGKKYHGFRNHQSWDVYTGSGMFGTKLSFEDGKNQPVLEAFRNYLQNNKGQLEPVVEYNARKLFNMPMDDEFKKLMEMSFKTEMPSFIKSDQMPNIINNNYYSSGSGQNGEANIDIGISFSEAMNSGITFSDLKLLNE